MRVLLAVEDADYGNAIVEFVLKHTWQPGTIMKLLHVVEPSSVGDRILALYGNGVDHEIMEERTKDGATLLGRFQERLMKNLPSGTPVELNQLIGKPHHVIAQVAEDWKADLIVMGSHARKGLSRFMLGSVSLSVLSHVQRSQCIVRLPEKDEKAGKGDVENVVLAVDDKLYGQHLAAFAAAQSTNPNTVYNIVSILEPISVPEVVVFSQDFQQQIDYQRTHARIVVEFVSDELKRLLPGAQIKTDVRLGIPEYELVSVIKSLDAKMLYIGSHGYKGLERALVGSVSASVVAHSHCSAVVLQLAPEVVNAYEREQWNLNESDLPQSMGSYEEAPV